MRNRYFNADRVCGINLTSDLEIFCFRWQVKNFCKINGLMKLYRKLYKVDRSKLVQILEEEHSFIPNNVNPYIYDGSRKGRVYYSWKGQIHYTENPTIKFLIRLFFKQIKYY